MKKKPDLAHQLTDEELEKLERRIAAEYKKAADDMQDKVDAYFKSFAKRDAETKALIGTIVNGEVYTKEKYFQWRRTQIARGERFEALRDKIAYRITHAKEVAFAYVNNDMTKIYAMNRAYTIRTIKEQAGDRLADVDFILFDEHTVKRLLLEQPDLMPRMPPKWTVNQKAEFEYGKRKVTEYVTQGIEMGSSVDQIAQNLRENFLGHYDRRGRWIPGSDINAARTAARTAITAAENAGRQDAREELESKGVILNKRWIATNDGRTRHDHALADGQIVMNDMPFEVGGEYLMFPGDNSMGASPWNLYNCRCSCTTEIAGFKSILTAEQRKRAKIRVE